MSGPNKNAPLPDHIRAFARELRQGSTDSEKRLWGLLRNRRFLGLKFRRQHPHPPFVLDFYCEELQLAIELDGGQHNSEVGRVYHDERSLKLHGDGIDVLRFWNHHLLADTEAVVATIYERVIHLQGLPKNLG